MPAATRLPEFSLPVSGRGTLSKHDLSGRRTILFFYPKDDTPGCTIEGHEFTELYPRFKQAGIEVFGVSPDSVESHEKFAEKCSLGIPLISDPDHVLIGALQLWVDKHFAGRSYKGVQRSTFLVAPDGSIEREWREVKAPGHAAEVLQAVAGQS